MNHAYIFDVDGTLTPSRQSITDSFRDLFVQFANNHDVYLITGSDNEKTIEQLSQDIVNESVRRCYNCSGNSVWERGIEIYSSPWTLPKDAENHLMELLALSECPTKAGNHLEVRPGAVNFSTVGRDATLEQRAEYILFDQETNEREMIVESFNTNFGSKLNCLATIGGETGIDITEVGKDKSQILPDFEGRIVEFFGDKCDIGGNDYPLAKAIQDRAVEGDKVHHVSGWEETMNILTNAR